MPAEAVLAAFRALAAAIAPLQLPVAALIDVQVDLLLVQNDYQRQAIRRRVMVELPGTNDRFGVLSCEDLILHKLMAGRQIDLADAAALLRANRDSLDWSCLRPWASELGLERELAQVWDEAFPGVPMPKSEP